MIMLFTKPESTAGSAYPAIVIGVFVAFGGILFGYDTGIIGGILASPHWTNEFSTHFFVDRGQVIRYLTPAQLSLIVSILSAGTFFGALFAAPTADYLGRRWALIVSTAVIFNMGVVLQTASTAIPMFVAGRFFAGLGVGLISAIIPLYQSETAPKWIRGAVVGVYQLAITLGLLLAAIVDNYCNKRRDSGSYRIPVAIQFAWSFILATGMLLLPETPRFRVKKGELDAAARSLALLRRLDANHPAVVEELAEIKANHEYELSLGQATYLECFKGNIGKRLATGCLLQSLQQLTGVNFIFYYGTAFFLNAGFPNAFHNTMITSGTNVASTLPGLYFVETWGRRNLLIFGAVGMSVCQMIIGITGTVVGTHNTEAQKALIALICIYIFFFACSWGPSAWIVTGELFPLKVRAKCLSMATASNWLLNWAIAYATPRLVNNNPNYPNEGVDLGPRIFFIWGSCCVLCGFFVWFLVYETKGLSLEQVDELYAKVSKAWKSPDFVPTVSFQEVQELNMDNRHTSLIEAEGAASRKRSTVSEMEGDYRLHY